ncbi:hypothetical protein CMO88_02755 [Candidatus Woesearchaeota archaeon]|jgi:hypothetical protein|nr:hypothetical protein [Candidatus Woesearchaeota archaeon]|tara:strand:+ start:15363 stop:15680 length:318 start_codon:yes stop_codon:yes gene_type:complete
MKAVYFRYNDEDAFEDNSIHALAVPTHGVILEMETVVPQKNNHYWINEDPILIAEAEKIARGTSPENNGKVVEIDDSSSLAKNLRDGTLRSSIVALAMQAIVNQE